MKKCLKSVNLRFFSRHFGSKFKHFKETFMGLFSAVRRSSMLRKRLESDLARNVRFWSFVDYLERPALGLVIQSDWIGRLVKNKEIWYSSLQQNLRGAPSCPGPNLTRQGGRPPILLQPRVPFSFPVIYPRDCSESWCVVCRGWWAGLL